MKKTLICTYLTLMLGSLAFVGCASREKTVDRSGATYEDSFENVAPAEKSVRAVDEVESN